MLTAIAIFHFTFPGFPPRNPPIHPQLPPPALCHNSSCLGGVRR